MESLNKLSLFIIICFCSVILCTEKPKCVSQHEELWPHPNPNYYWLCEHEGSDPIKKQCPEDTGFLRHIGTSGCVPYIDWNCTAKSLKPPSCDTIADYNKPHRHPNPNKFWGCPEPMNTPGTELKCEEGKGFVDNTENLNCIQFESTPTNSDEWVCAEAGNKIRE